MRFATALLAIVSSLLLVMSAAAQTTGAIEGTVRDPSDASVAGAVLSFVEAHTNASRTLTTDATGHYLALRLVPGLYEIRVSHPGFREEIRKGVDLGAGRTARVNFTLQLGEARDEIVVVAATPPVSMSTEDWGASVEAMTLAELPLNGRNLFDLSSQQPGASVPPTALKKLTQGLGIKLSVNGARPSQNGFRLDGIFINDASSSMPASAAGGLLGVETIRELRTVTSPFSAEFGRSAGSVITAVSKSGSNTFHGSLYEFFRNSALDAKNFFDQGDEKIPPLRRNQFGGLLSGPLRRDKLFFLTNYEAIRESRSTTVRPAVPTLDARQGRLPTQGGGIEHVTVAPAARPYLELYPEPNGHDFGDGTAEFVNDSVRSTREDYVAAKLDYLPSERFRLSWRYTFDDANSIAPDPLRVWRFSSESGYQFLHSEAQYIHSPRTIQDFRAGFSRVRNAETSSTTVPESLSFVPGQPLGAMQVVGLADFGGLSARLRPRRLIVNDFQLNNDLVHIRGRHTIRFGAGLNRVQFNQQADLSAVGYYIFGSLSDLLQGKPRRGEVMLPGSDSVRGWRQNQFFAYFQEDYRVGLNLSLSLGVRYEAYSTPTEVNGKIATLPDPLNDTAVTVGGPLFKNPSKDNFAPRASVAWDPFGSGKTVVRAGAGIFFDLISTRELVVAGVRVPPFFNRAVITYPVFPNILDSVGSAGSANALDGLDFRPNQPYVAQFQFMIERQLGADLVARAGYAGSRGIHLIGHLFQANPARPEILPDGRLFFPAGAARLNPSFEQIGMRRTLFNSVYHAFVAGVERRWRNQVRFQGSYTWGKSIDENSNPSFNDFANALYMPTPFDYRQNRGPSAFDLRHVLSANFSWELPGLGTSPAGWMLRGWGLHGLVQAQTGNAFAPTVGFDRARLRPPFGDLDQRPNFVGGDAPDLILGDPGKYFDPSAFALPPPGFYGNLGRGTLSGPGLVVLDLAVHKVVWQREKHGLRIRLECFNLLNHPNFQIPSGLALFNSSLQRLGTAGRITETSTTSRQIQIGAKWVF